MWVRAVGRRLCNFQYCRPPLRLDGPHLVGEKGRTVQSNCTLKFTFGRIRPEIKVSADREQSEVYGREGERGDVMGLVVDYKMEQVEMSHRSRRSTSVRKEI